jgi:hypothetical protein
MVTRAIKRVSTSIPTLEGAGVHLKRALCDGGRTKLTTRN